MTSTEWIIARRFVPCELFELRLLNEQNRLAHINFCMSYGSVVSVEFQTADFLLQRGQHIYADVKVSDAVSKA